MGLDLSARRQGARSAGLRLSSGGDGNSGEVVETPMQELLRKMDEMSGQVRELVAANQEMRDEMRHIKAQAATRADGAHVGSMLSSGMSSSPRKADGSSSGRTHTGAPRVASEAATVTASAAEMGGGGVDSGGRASGALQAYRANGVPGVGLGYAV